MRFILVQGLTALGEFTRAAIIPKTVWRFDRQLCFCPWHLSLIESKVRAVLSTTDPVSARFLRHFSGSPDDPSRSTGLEIAANK